MMVINRLALLSAAAAAVAVVMLCCPPGAAADKTVDRWNALLRDALVQKKIGAHLGLAPLPPLANLLCGGRLMSLLHVAQWQAVDGVLKANNVTTYEAAKASLPTLEPALAAAVAGAGKAVLDQVLPEYQTQTQQLYEEQLTAANAWGQQTALDLGAAGAQATLALRAGDGANATFPEYRGSEEVGRWRPTPPAFKAGGCYQWTNVTPWVMDAPDQMRPMQPPSVKSKEYERSYLEVMKIGNKTSEGRTATHTQSVFLWNEFPDALLFSVVDQATKDDDIIEATRTYAVAAAAGVDARVLTMDAKYFYSTWRPVSAIPVGSGINLPADPAFEPVIPTPPTPEFPSGHAIHGEAIIETLRRKRGARGDATKATAADAMPVTLTSATPLPSVTAKDAGPAAGTETVTRSYASLTEVAQDLAVSRIEGGLHWRDTVERSTKLGLGVGRKVYEDFDRKYTTFNGAQRKPNKERRLRQ